MTKLVSSTSVSLFSTMSFTIVYISFEFSCSPSSFFLMYVTLSGFSAISIVTVSLCFAFSASSTSSNKPMFPGGTAFLLSAMSSTAVVFFPSFVSISLSMWWRSSSSASCWFSITICTSPVAMSMSLTFNFIYYHSFES